MSQSHENPLKNWEQKWKPVPQHKKMPICIIGAGGVVKSHHLPSYKVLGLEVYGVFDVNKESAQKMSEEFGIKMFSKMEEMIIEVQEKFENRVIYDVATPPHTFLSILDKLPDSSKILLQKPLGKTLTEANQIYLLSKRKNFDIAVNLQGRYAPAMLLVKKAIDEGIFGELHEITCTENTHTPWNLWGWLKKEERMEILYHSIHVIDVFRYFMNGDPTSVYCRAISSPEWKEFKDTKSSIILDFGKEIMARINSNHSFKGLPDKACSEIYLEGTKAAAIVRMGGNLNYPYGIDDQLLFCIKPQKKSKSINTGDDDAGSKDNDEIKDEEYKWEEIPLQGNWFPNAFEGPMCNLQRYVNHEDDVLLTSLDNVIGTMSVIEACYESNSKGGTVLPVPILQPVMNNNENIKMKNNELVIVDITAKDIRFPTSKTLAGSDATHTDPDYSAVYVTIHTNDLNLSSGNGLTFTLGRGNEICMTAVQSLKKLVVGRSLNSIISNFNQFWREITSESQLRWLGPEKGVIHLVTCAIINAIWDLWAKKEKKPVWKLLTDMDPQQLVNCIDFRYIEDVLTPKEALEILNNEFKFKKEREENIKKIGFPAYTMSVGWLGYSDQKIKDLCKEALSQGFTHFKMKVGANLEDDKRRASIIRKEIGWENKLSMDANQRWSVDEAIHNMKELSIFKPHWIEEPTSPDDILGHARIAKEISPIGVATGEQCHNRVIFKQLFQMKSFSFCQIDACRVGSINEILSILLMAKKFNVPVCPHAGGVGLCEYVQHLSIFDYICISGSLENRVIEFADHLHEHFVDPVHVVNGRYQVPMLPGYSIDMKKQSLIDFEYPNGKEWANSTTNYNSKSNFDSKMVNADIENGNENKVSGSSGCDKIEPIVMKAH